MIIFRPISIYFRQQARLREIDGCRGEDYRESFSRMEKERSFTGARIFIIHVRELRTILSTISSIHTHDEILLGTAISRSLCEVS